MNLQETGEWAEGVYQLETTDPVIGGEDGIDNLQAKQLANRTSFLKTLLTKIVDGTTSVGKAIKLATARKIALSGVVMGEATFDGSANVTIELAFVDGQLTISKVTGLSDALTGKQAASNLLSALAGLSVTAANKMIYSNGNSSFALTDLSAFARTLLDDTSGGDMFTTMGATQSTLGYIIFPNGWIIQAKKFSVAADSTRVTFPISFPTNCIACIPQLLEQAAGAFPTSVFASLLDKNGFYLRLGGFTGGTAQLDYIAIGY